MSELHDKAEEYRFSRMIALVKPFAAPRAMPVRAMSLQLFWRITGA